MSMIADWIEKDGLFMHFWNYNRNNEEVYPYLDKNKMGFYISPTGKNTDYEIVGVEDFIRNLANGVYSGIEHIRMKTPKGTQRNGFSINSPKHGRSEELIAELKKIRTGNSSKISVSNSSDKINETKIANKPFQAIKSIEPTDEIDDIEAVKESLAAIANDTERNAVVKSRIGQGIFRELLIQNWGACSVTGMNFVPILRASHIKPWSVSSNEERLDPENGLLLTPNLDVAFDRGFISFSDDGDILISSELSIKIQTDLGIHHTMKLSKISDGNKKYLNHHRNSVFRN